MPPSCDPMLILFLTYSDFPDERTETVEKEKEMSTGWQLPVK